jgi:hypothetical protein
VRRRVQKARIAKGRRSAHAQNMQPSLAPLPGPEAVLIGLVALVIVSIPLLWPLADHLDAMAHEGAHAVAVSAMGLPIVAVLLDENAGGVTRYRGSDGGAGEVLIGVVGYLGPSAFGLGAAKLISTGHVIAVLWLALLFLVLLLFLIRRSFGLISVPLAIVAVVFVIRFPHGWLEEVTIYSMTWLLLLSGLRNAVSIRHMNGGDPKALGEITMFPRQFWALLWIAATGFALVVGFKWLVLRS